MNTCREVADEVGLDIVEMSHETWESDREVAMSVCADGSFNKATGTTERSTVESCDEEWATVHTHPPGNPARPSRLDLGDFLKTEPGDYVDRMCVVGSGYPVKMRCLKIDRSGMSREEYIEMVNDVDDYIKEEPGVPDISEEWDEVDACTTYLH